MFCPNCNATVSPTEGYCASCGMSTQARLCPNGHVMDPSWTECRSCQPGAIARAGSPSAAGSKGRTVVEPASNVPPGGFVRGAALLGEGFGRSGTRVERSERKGDTVVDSGAPNRSGKAKTVFDPGTGASEAASPAVPARRMPKLVGWLVTFSSDPSGQDYRLRRGPKCHRLRSVLRCFPLGRTDQVLQSRRRHVPISPIGAFEFFVTAGLQTDYGLVDTHRGHVLTMNVARESSEGHVW
jgi:hypothetical protein